MQIVELTGLSWPAVRTAIDLYEAGGLAAHQAERARQEKRGRPEAFADQEAHIQKLIVEKRPEQLKMEFALWTRAAVGKLIEDEFQIKLSVRGVGKYLKRWGFTPQKPIRRAYEQSPEAVKKWLDEGVSVNRGKGQGGRRRDPLGRRDGLGEHPRARPQLCSERRDARHACAWLAPETVDDLDRDQQGEARWMIIDGNFNADELIEFLEALIKDATKKVFLILDNLRAHHSKPVKDWLAERTDRIEVFYLPSYAPELNPDERLNADMKHAIGAKVPVRTKPKLKAAAEDHMTMIGKSPDSVCAYFQDPRVKLN